MGEEKPFLVGVVILQVRYFAEEWQMVILLSALVSFCFNSKLLCGMSSCRICKRNLLAVLALMTFIIFQEFLAYFLCFSAKQLMCELGNDVINRVYEAKVEKMGIKKPQPGQRYYFSCLNVLSFFSLIRNIAMILFHHN